MLEKALAEGYAIPAFNICNMESAQAVAEVAAEKNVPVIISVSEGAGKYAGYDYIRAIVETASKKSSNDIALHLDHGKSFEACKAAIDAGFTSVMIDASHLSYEENIAATKQVVEYAHARNVTVEAELGKIIGTEDMVHSDTESFTDPDEAKDFVSRTGVDSLAISIGTAHGVNKSIKTPVIQYGVIESVHKALPALPLVAHGSSTVPVKWVEEIIKYGGEIKKSQGISEEDIVKMSKSAICKINMDTDLRLAHTAGVRKDLAENPGHFDQRDYNKAGKANVKEQVAHAIELVEGV
ncbi:MAG: class II fructose-bisphosphate aldolase family protein [Clostridia bacterium]|nr:class II fructose-bisphosphate aldolase family protein [Clostridia bacterium]